MVLLSSAQQGSGARASGTGDDGPRGVVTGKYFNFNPLPPSADVLGNALVVPDLPTHKLPREKFGNRMRRWLARFNIGAQSAQTRMRWKVQDTVASVLASVSPSVTLSAEQRAKLKRNGQAVTMIIVRHPYHLRHVLDMIPQLPDELGPERRFLELLMSRIIKKYAEQMSLIKGSAFSFENEAREYLFAGFRMEMQIKKITSPDERFGALQAIYNNYFHGKNYYYYALLRREKLAPENKLFMLYSRASYFNARIDWNGELLDKPAPRALPTRGTVMFLLQRDKSVLARYRTDQEFQKQVKTCVEAFPE